MENRMTTQEAIGKMFPQQKQTELSSIWNLVFSSEMSAILGKPTLDPTKLDDCLISQYGEYEGSLKDFIINKFGEETFKAIK